MADEVTTVEVAETETAEVVEGAEPNPDLNKIIEESQAKKPDDEPAPAETPAETEEEEVVVPALVEEYMPGLAGSWASLTADQRKAVELDLARGLEQGETSGEVGEAAKKGEAEELPPAPSKKPAQEPAPAPRSEKQFRLRDEPEAITAEEVKTAISYLDDPDGNVAKLFKKLLARTDFAVQTASELVPLALQAIDESRQFNNETRQSVTTMVDERALGVALERRTAEFRGFKREQFDQVVDRAKAIRKEGRTRDWGDAVSLALVEQKYNIKPAKAGETAAPDKRQEAEKLATSLARTGKTRGRQPQLPDGPKTLADIFEFHRRRLGAGAE